MTPIHGVRALALALVVVPASVGAQDCDAPCIGYAVSTELENFAIVDARPNSDATNALEPTIDVSLALAPVDEVRLVGVLVTESVRDATPGKDRAFEDIGTFAEELYVEMDLDPVTLRAGKLNPTFGLATDVLDGIAATDLVGDYDNTEKLGAEGLVEFEAFGVAQALTASVFTVDRTEFSESVFTDRGRFRLEDGGAGNTRGFGSFVLFHDACWDADAVDCFDEGVFGVRTGLRYQKAGRATAEDIEDEIVPRDEFGYLVAPILRIDIDDDTTLRLLTEFAYFEHVEGSPDDAMTTTGSAAVEFGSWVAMATYSRRRNFVVAEPDTTDELVDLTIEHDLDGVSVFGPETWKLAAGYSYAENGDGTITHSVNLRLSINLEGASAIGGN
jgi:hypothetical protein